MCKNLMTKMWVNILFIFYNNTDETFMSYQLYDFEKAKINTAD